MTSRPEVLPHHYPLVSILCVSSFHTLFFPLLDPGSLLPYIEFTWFLFRSPVSGSRELSIPRFHGHLSSRVQLWCLPWFLLSALFSIVLPTWNSNTLSALSCGLPPGKFPETITPREIFSQFLILCPFSAFPWLENRSPKPTAATGLLP